MKKIVVMIVAALVLSSCCNCGSKRTNCTGCCADSTCVSCTDSCTCQTPAVDTVVVE